MVGRRVTIVIDIIVEDLVGIGVHTALVIVAVGTPEQGRAVAIAVGIIVIVPAAVGIDTIVPSVFGTRMSGLVQVVAIRSSATGDAMTVSVSVIVIVARTVPIDAVVPNFVCTRVCDGSPIIAVAVPLSEPVAIGVIQTEGRKGDVIEAPLVTAQAMLEDDGIDRVRKEHTHKAIDFCRQRHIVQLKAIPAPLDSDLAIGVDQPHRQGRLVLFEVQHHHILCGDRSLGIPGWTQPRSTLGGEST
jgi:hypothetical protein